MALKLLKVPLTASIKERLRADKAALKLHRIAPPTATQVPPPPDQTPPAEPPAEGSAESVAGKKRHGNRYSDDYRATIVARVLKGIESGEEDVLAIAKAEGLDRSTIYGWIRAAKATNGKSAKPSTKAASKPANRPKGGRFPLEYREKIVARVLKGRETGEENGSTISRAEGLSESLVSLWVRRHLEANGKFTPDARRSNGKSDGSGGDLKSLARELAEAMDRVTSIKKRMRKLLGAD
jgi:transposase-like protein